MKIRITTLVICAVVFAGLASCSNDPSSKPEPKDLAVRFQGAMATRAYDGSWNAGDGIGLAMLGTDGKTIIEDIYNYNYYTPSNTGSFEPRIANKTIYFPQDGSQVAFKGYYPYHEALEREMLMPLNVASQAELPAIDFMTTKPTGVYSKDDRVVKLVFQHRLSKLIFDLNIAQGEPAFPLDDLTLNIKGMPTRGSYDILNDALTVNEGSVQGITVPYVNIPSERDAIALPRAAAEGVEFEFTNSKGGKYVAYMDPALELKSGYKYTFHITLSRTPIVVTAEIDEWLNGGSTSYEIVQVGSSVGNNENIGQGARMRVYSGDLSNNFSLLSTYTYMSNDTWNPDPAVLWDDMPDPAILRASMTGDPALNQTQLPDILIAPEVSTPRYSGVHFDFAHALAKTIITLESSDPSIITQLNNAVVILPQYVSGGSESNGIFTYGDGTVRTDITAEKITSQTSTSFIALLEPQEISIGNNALMITIGGSTYEVEAQPAAVEFRAGYVTRINVRINASQVTLSASITDWIDTDPPIDLNALALTVIPPSSVNIPDNAELELYRHTSGNPVLLSTYTYNSSTQEWTANPEIVWEDLEDQETFHGSMFVHAAYDATQLDDYYTSAPVTVQKNQGIFLELTHPAAKVTVQLKSDIYTDAELEQATVVLPQYLTGGTYTDGVFTRGQNTGDIDLYFDGISLFGIIDPQTRIAGNIVARVNTPNTGTHTANTYDVISADDIEFKPGYNTILVITINESDFIISARMTDWQTEEPIPLVPEALQIGGTREDTNPFFQGQTIYLYMGNPIEEYGYSYTQKPSGWSWEGTALYWDDLQVSPSNPLTVTGMFFPHPTLKPTGSPIQQTFEWNLPTDQTNGYQDYDILSSNISITTPQYVNFLFRHTLSKVRVVLTSNEFELNELKGASIAINGLVMTGSIDLNSGNAIPGSAKVSVIPYTETDGQVYSALVMPGTAFNTTDNVISITLPDYPATPFSGKLTAPMTLVAGSESVITINLKKTGIILSAKYEKWSDGSTGSIIIQ